jgi:GNAT superfamily N-acetyltransferase
MHCRLAETKDLAVLADMRWRLKTDDTPVYDQQAYTKFIQEFVAWAQSPNAFQHWIAENDGRAVGAMSVAVVEKPPSPNELTDAWGYVTNAYVYPEARNQRAGEALLSQITDWARSQNLELLVVWPSERAYPFYERAGFRSERDPLVMPV